MVEGQIGLDRRIIEIGAALAQLFGVIAPIPGSELEVAALLRNQLLQRIAIGQRAGAGWLPDPLQQTAHGLRRLGHGVLQAIGREGREAQDFRGLLAQLQDFDDGLVVVIGVAIVAALDEGLVGLLAQVAPRRAFQERLHRGPRRGDDRLASHAALVSRGPGRGDEALGEPIEIAFAQLHEPLLLVAEQMMAETGAEMREALVDLGHPRLGGLVEAGAGAVEAGIGPLQETHLFGGEAELGAFVVQRHDAAEQYGIHHDRIPVPRHPRRHVLVDLQDRRIGMRRHQIVEHRCHTAEQLAGALQRRDRIGEVRRGRIVHDRGNLGRMVEKRLFEGRHEVLGLDLVERRGLERGLPGFQKRIFETFRRNRRDRRF